MNQDQKVAFIEHGLGPLFSLGGAIAGAIPQEQLAEMVNDLRAELSRYEAIGILDGAAYPDRLRKMEANTVLAESAIRFIDACRGMKTVTGKDSSERPIEEFTWLDGRIRQ